jgi:hypothetical protein
MTNTPTNTTTTNTTSMFNYTTRKLKYCPYGQAKADICTNENNEIVSIVLWSYSTIVCVLLFFNNKVDALSCTGLYSMTTRKHITFFLREFCPSVDLQLIKKIAGENAQIRFDKNEKPKEFVYFEGKYYLRTEDIK